MLSLELNIYACLRPSAMRIYARIEMAAPVRLLVLVASIIMHVNELLLCTIILPKFIILSLKKITFLPRVVL